MVELDPRRARVFGAHAEAYDRWRPGYPAEAVAWLLPPGARRVVDVGAGTGKLTAGLLAHGVEVVAVEPDPAMLAVLRRTCPAAEAHMAGADRLPVPDGSVDAVTAGQAWHWFPHERTVAEVRRVLRPGGGLGLVWNGPDPVEDWERQLLELDPDTREWDGSRMEVPGLPPDELEEAEFRWTRPVSGPELRARLLTHSSFLTMEQPERDRLLAEMVAVVDAETARRGTPTVPLHQAAYCVRWRP
jgi:SAM-dependent methyltransferase